MPRRNVDVTYYVDSLAPMPAESEYASLLHLGTYNYSGLNGHPRVIEAAAAALYRYGTTTSGVRLLNGTSDLHLLLERKLASYLGVEDAVTFSSGFAANIAVLSCLCSESDVVFSDELNHQSIADGLKLSGAKVVKYLHQNMDSLRAMLSGTTRLQRKFIVTDGIFSMDGDVALLDEIFDLAEEFNALVIVDEAHATAAYGACGRGVVSHMGHAGRIDVITGSLSKGLPGIGGFAAGQKKTMDLLRVGSNPYIFSASIPPSVAAGLIAAIEILEAEPEIQDTLHHNENYLRDGLKAMGLNTMSSASPIIPVLMPSRDTTFRFATLLHEDGIYVNAVCFPAVSRKWPRLRINASASLEPDDLDRALEGFGRVARKLQLIA
jgi:glycine C-acetyltransferase